MSRGKTRRAVALTLAVSMLALLGVAQAASAATISLNQSCYLLNDDTDFTFSLTASGLPVGRIVWVHAINFNTTDETMRVGPDGTISFQSGDSIPYGTGLLIYPGQIVAEEGTVTIEDTITHEIYAQTPIWISRFGMQVSSEHTEGGKVTFRFAGLAPGVPVYAHYVVHKKEVFTHEIGVTSGPCGALETKAKLYPRKHSKYNFYLVQFDQKKKYSPKTKPSWKHGLETGRF